VSNIVIIPNLKRTQARQERRHVFSEETTLYLLRLLRGDSGLPDALGGVIAVPRDLQLELATAIRQRILPWFWSISLHLVILILLLLIVFPVIRVETIDELRLGMATIPVPFDHPVLGPPGDNNGNVPAVAEVQNGAPEDNEPTTPQVEPPHPSPGLDF
jgi:hypothetical protein